MRKPLIICIVLAAAGALTAGLALAATPPTKTIKVDDNSDDNWFYKRSPRVPRHPSVPRNTRLRFHFVGESSHNVIGYRGSTSGTPKFESEYKDSGYYKTPKLTKTGMYTIVCDLHGEFDQSMKIKVKNP